MRALQMPLQQIRAEVAVEIAHFSKAIKDDPKSAARDNQCEYQIAT